MRREVAQQASQFSIETEIAQYKQQLEDEYEAQIREYRKQLDAQYAAEEQKQDRVRARELREYEA